MNEDKFSFSMLVEAMPCEDGWADTLLDLLNGKNDIDNVREYVLRMWNDDKDCG